METKSKKTIKIIVSLFFISFPMSAALDQSVHSKDNHQVKMNHIDPEDNAKIIKAKHHKPQVSQEKEQDRIFEENAEFLKFVEEQKINPDNDSFNKDIPKKESDKNNYDKKYEKHAEIESTLVKKRKNFTTCEEFLNNTKLDVNKVVDIQWKVFYYWLPTDEMTNTEHFFTFQIPTETLVQRFKAEMADVMKGVNWTAAELFLENTMDFSTLFLATNVSGMYNIVPSVGFEFDMKTEDLMSYHFGIRYLEPHYLGMLNCRYRQMLALAPFNKMPNKKEIKAAAAKFNFRGDYGVSYLELTKEIKSGTTPKAPKHENERELDHFYDGLAPSDMDLNTDPLF